MKPSIIRVLAASALLGVTATATTAQAAVESGTTATAASTPWAKVPVGKYELQIQMPERTLAATLTIKDSSGTPTATFLPEGDQDAHPVKITVKTAELYVNGDADKGPFEIVVLRQGNDLTGHWSYGGENGKLTGKAVPSITN
jgi:endonuclease/exonuclease/phosphatase (EEP) superfamily protein YafD